MRKGFSLIELMVVIAIIALLSMIALPMYSRYAQGHKATEGSQLIMELVPKLELYRAKNLIYPADLTDAAIAKVFNTSKGEYFDITYAPYIDADGIKRFTIITKDHKKATGNLGVDACIWKYDSGVDSKPHDDDSLY